MKRMSVRYFPKRRSGPMSFWVHGLTAYGSMEEMDTQERERYMNGLKASGLDSLIAFEPLPKATEQGYPFYEVEVDGFTFEFASLAEIQKCIEVLSQKHLPRVDIMRKSQAGEFDVQARVNQHWLNRLPSEVTSWNKREKIVAYLQKALEEFAKDT